jgi:hypothetical protein
MESCTGGEGPTWVKRIESAIIEADSSDPDIRYAARSFLKNAFYYAKKRDWPCLVARLEPVIRRLDYGK